MKRLGALVGWLFALGLIIAGCSDSTGGTAGTGGSGGSGGSGGGLNEDAQLVYEDEPLLLDTVNGCQIASDGMDSLISAVVQSEGGAPNQVVLTLGLITEPVMGTGLFDTVTMQGSVVDLELGVVGQFDLVDFDPGVVQLITGGTCVVDFVFSGTTAVSGVDVYDVSFECPTLQFDWLDTGVEPPVVTGSGALTDLSGQFPCFMTQFVAD